ncbi:MAG: hypothetical protein ACREQY_04160, partial [Candidatus Binatia bacterium]
GPFRAGFLRELAARHVRIRIRLREEASVAPTAATDGVETVLRELAPGGRISAISLDGLRLEVRSGSRAPLVVDAAAGRWRPGDDGLVLSRATVRSEHRRAEFSELVWRPGARPYRPKRTEREGFHDRRVLPENASALEEILAASNIRFSEAR